MEAINANQCVNHIMVSMNQDVAGKLDGDCIFIWCGMQSPLDDELRVVIEDLVAERDNGDDPTGRLIVLLETNGGYIEVVERIVSVMRKHYEEVYFVVAGHAYSAGTVLVMSGDKIYMDYYSVLGPIDPQYQDDEGHSLLPGAGYLAKFEELTKKINNSRSASPNATKAELAYLIKRFDPAKLFHIEQAIEHGQSLITEWLPKYKFKNWKTTRTKKKRVTAKVRRDRAAQVAKVLGKADRWHSHGRGISMRELEDAEINLLVDDFGCDKNLSSAIRNYHGLAVDYARKNRVRGFIHTRQGMRTVL